jgi:hypothetical protein
LTLEQQVDVVHAAAAVQRVVGAGSRMLGSCLVRQRARSLLGGEMRAAALWNEEHSLGSMTMARVPVCVRACCWGCEMRSERAPHWHTARACSRTSAKSAPAPSFCSQREQLRLCLRGSPRSESQMNSCSHAVLLLCSAAIGIGPRTGHMGPVRLRCALMFLHRPFTSLVIPPANPGERLLISEPCPCRCPSPERRRTVQGDAQCSSNGGCGDG